MEEPIRIQKTRKILEDMDKIFIISAGRTGTMFLAHNLKKIMPGTISLHEPDKVSINNLKRLKEEIKRQGFFNSIILRALGINGSGNLSIKRISGKINSERALNIFLETEVG